MGLFSGETIYTVETATTRVIEDDMVPDTTLQAIIRSVLKDEPMVDHILDASFQSIGHKVEKAHRQAKRDYPQSLLKGEVGSNRGSASLITAAIQADTGHTPTLIYGVLSPLNYNHQLRQILVEEHGYDEPANEITSLSDASGKVTLVDYAIRVPEALFDLAVSQRNAADFDTGPTSGPTPERATAGLLGFMAHNPGTLVSEVRSDILAEVKWIREDPEDGSLTRGTLEFVLPQGDSDWEHYQAKYTHAGATYYWTYRYGSGVHPDLDSALEVSYTSPGEYLPVIYFRNDHRNLGADEYRDDPGFAGAQDFLDTIGLDYDTLNDAIHDNEDIDDVRYAYLMFGVSVAGESQDEKRYLFEYFDDVHGKLADLDATERSSDLRYVVNITSAEPGDLHSGARMTLATHGMSRRVKGGHLGKRGSYHTTTSTQTVTDTVRVRVNDGEGGIKYEVREVSFDVDTLIVQHQHTDRSFVQLEIVKPFLRHHIDGSGRGTNNFLGDPDFLIPVDRSLLEGWNSRRKESLYSRSMHFVFNARDKQKVKWYETGFFKAVITFAAIVITVASAGATWQAVAAAATLKAAALVVLEMVLINLVLSYAFSFVAKQLGGEAALILAAVATVVGGYKSFKAGSLQGAPWAEELLRAASGLAEAVSEMTSDLLADLGGKYEDFADYKAARLEELNQAQDLLATPDLIDPLDLVTRREPVLVTGESPEAFYNRTIHAGNVGVLSLDAIGSYVDNALKLPTFQDTLGGL